MINKLLKRRNLCVQCIREESLLGLPHREHSALMDQGRPQAGALLPLGAEEGGGQGTVPSWSRKRAGPRRGLLASSQRGRWSHFWSWKDDREVASAEPSGGLSQEWDKVPPSVIQASVDCWCRAPPRGPGVLAGESATGTEQAEKFGEAPAHVTL